MIRQTRTLRRLGILGLALGLFPASTPGDIRSGGSRERLLLDSSILVARFERCLQSNDVEEFAQSVSAALPESTLARLLREGDVSARRASAYALGTLGTYRVNAAVAAGLKDTDSVVRMMADRALRAIWYRADTPENNERLRKIMILIDRGNYDLAIEQAGALIKLAPTFAEAYNQRAIAHFFAGRAAESAADCRKTLELNPYHLGALGGLGQCMILLDKRAEALAVYRRASALSPYEDSFKIEIAKLEAGE